MASLILHGDGSAAEAPLNRPIYVRPFMRPGKVGENDGEKVPDSVLPPDLTWRAIRRMFVGESDGPPAAPKVCIVNLSIGDPFRAFDRSVSPWARALDWLAWEHRVLVLTSAGNYSEALHLLEIPRESAATASADEIEGAVLRTMARVTWERRLHSPAESVNSLTVGATHKDGFVEGSVRCSPPGRTVIGRSAKHIQQARPRVQKQRETRNINARRTPSLS